MELHLKLPKAWMHEGSTKESTIVFETAPLDVMPHTVLTFLQGAAGWRGGIMERGNKGEGIHLDPETPETAPSPLFLEAPPGVMKVQEGTIGYVRRKSKDGHDPTVFVATTKQAGSLCSGSSADLDFPYGSCFGSVIQGHAVLRHMAQDLGRHEALQVAAMHVREANGGDAASNNT